jgi:S1-C subfamily serine protease
LATLLLTGAPSHAPAETDVRRDATVNAVEQVMPSVVNIGTETVVEYHELYDELLRQFYGWSHAPRHQQKLFNLGSGVIIDEDGYVLTNFHVVRRAGRIQVKLWDGREYDADPWVYTEATDIAVLKLRTKPGEKFKPIKFAAGDDLLLGETVLALGNPYGLGAAVTKGILSSKNRRPATGNEPLQIEDWLQTDAAINPGNSGGPLVDLRGQLIGVNVAVYRDPQQGERGVGVGFAIPIKQVAAALSRYSTPELTDSLWFGAQFKAGTGPLVVSSVQTGSPAAKAGLKAGDELIELNGQAPRTLIACNRLLCSASEHRASLVVAQNGERQTLTVQLRPFEDLIRQRLGLTLLEVTPTAAERLGIKPGEALYIDSVDKGGPADDAELQRGYLVVAIENQPATKLRAVAEALLDRKKGDAVQLTVIVPRRFGASYMEFRQGTVELKVR